MLNILIVVATAGEAARLSDLGQPSGLAAAGVRVQVVVSGVGAVAAALATQQAITSSDHPRPDLVISAGIGGAFEGSGLRPGMLAIASQIVQADLGAWDGERFLGLADLGLEVAPQQHGSFATWQGGPLLGRKMNWPCGPFVTVNSATGSQAGAAELLRRVRGALVEGMEGAGVAHAAYLSGIPVTELRGISNMVGPRNRASWDIAGALAALRGGLETLIDVVEKE